MHLDERIVAELRGRYGEPHRLELELELSAAERDLVRASTRRGRHHDVTFFVLAGERLALIRKPQYPPGLWRPPGGGVKPREPFEAGARREAREELGVGIELERYLVHVSAVFRHAGEAIPWTTHVFAASTAETELSPIDTREIAAARWGTLGELAGPLREAMLATRRALWGYRVALHDAALLALRRG